MTKIIKEPVKIMRFFNKKGQGIVEFALLLAFCVGVGLAAREAGLAEALDAAFGGTSNEAAKEEIIVPGQSNGVTEYTSTKTINASTTPPTKSQFSSTSSEKSDFDFLNALADFYTNSDTNVVDQDKVWEAYKGNKTYASAADETKARNAALAVLGKGITGEGDNAVTDAVWKDLKKANDWAFDIDDATINNFLNDFFGTNGNVDENDPKIAELKKRNIFFANLSNQQIATMANNRNHKENFNYTGGDAVYEGYLAIKKQFWSTDASGNNTAKAVALDLAPLITDAAFAATSDEKKIFNYVNGVNGTKGVVPYFGQYASAQLSDIGARLQKELDVFKLNNSYVADDDNDNLITTMFSATKIEDISDDFWVQIKENNGWVRDAEDTSIRDQLLNEFINTDENKNKSVEELVAEVQEQNAQFKNLGNKTFADGTKGTNVIAKMISNAKDNKSTLEDKDVYRGYLSIKKEFWASGDNIDLTFVKPGSNDFNSVKGRIENYINSCINDNTKVKSGNKEDGLNESLAAFTVIRYKDPNTQETEYYLTLEDGRTYDFRYNDVKTQVGYAGNNAYVIPISNTNYYGIANVSSNNFPGLNMGDVIILESGAAYIYRDPYVSNKVYPYTSDESYYDSQTALVKLNIPIQ